MSWLLGKSVILNISFFLCIKKKLYLKMFIELSNQFLEFILLNKKIYFLCFFVRFLHFYIFFICFNKLESGSEFAKQLWCGSATLRSAISTVGCFAGGFAGALGDGLREAEPHARAAQLHAGHAAAAALPAPAGRPAVRSPGLVRYGEPSGQAGQELHPWAGMQGIVHTLLQIPWVCSRTKKK